MDIDGLQTKLLNGQTDFNNGELILLLKSMAQKINLLENKLIHKSVVSKKYSKECTLEWLNENETDHCDIDEWINTIDFQQYLQHVFDNNLEQGTIALLTANIHTLPIKTNKKYRSDYYVFHNRSWTTWNSDKIHLFIKKCTLKFLHVFSLWSLNNQSSFIENENREQLYLLYYNRVLGPEKTDILYNNIRKFIYRNVITDI